jgi:NAD(P)-dependent dehydrogenase (short-subunit alcohol dehydrogenase family)
LRQLPRQVEEGGHDESVDEAAGFVDRTFGHLDILMNNAGIARGATKPSETSVGDLRATYETNVFAVVRVTNAFLPLLCKANAARIVNVTSKRGSLGDAGA